MKKFFSLVLIFITALVLTACGEKITLTLNEADKTIAIETGGEITVTPTVTEGFELEWTSGDLDIVKVIPGYDTLSAIIQAVGEGSVTVTVKVKDKDVRTTITIVVTDPDPISVTVAGAGNVAIGAQLTLTGSVYPAKANQALTWSTADALIATVSAAGVVTGVAEGTVKIKATTEIETIFVEVTVNVVKPDPTGVTVSGPTSIIAGENGTYTASVAPVLASPNVVWSTSDASLATITAEGVLTALLPGTIKVRATSAVKGTVYGEIDLTIVHPDPVSITVSGATEVIALESATYTAVVLPALAVQTVTWSTSDVTKATIDATTGVLTGVAKGTVNVIATSTAKGTIVGQFAVTIGPEKSQINMVLDGGYWPITGTDAFVTADPTATATLRFGYNPASAEYYVAGTGSNHFNHLFLQDKDRKISPSVWQNRAFLNRNANGFFEVQVVKLAGSANTNPPLDDYEYTLYAHEGFTAGYNFIASLQVGQIITLNGFDINAQSVFEIGDVVVNVYTAEQATSTANLVAPGETVVTLPIPGKLGASFDGWYATAEFTGEPVLTVNTTATVYAKWSYDLSAVAVKADVAAGAAYYSAQASKYFVSGKTLFATLEEALAAVEADGTVYLEAGTYDAVANVTKNNITIKGTVDSIVSAAINVAANVEGLTIDGVKFTGVGQVVLALAGGVKNFTFKNNVATDLAIGNGTFISFKNDGTANNENFVIENNQFLIGAATVAPRWIRGGNILGFTVVNNIFEGLAGVYVDGIRIEGTNETNSEGIGLGGIVLIEGNQFNEVGQRGIWVRRISATQIDVTNNVFDQTGGETAGGGLQLEVLVPGTVLVVDIYENEFKNITHYFGIRIGTTAVPNIGTVTIKFNKFVSFTLATAYYIQGYDGATTINANSNYFDVAPTAEDMAFVSSYTPVYATLEELATAIAMSKPQTLTYESNGGSAVAPEEVPGGFKATKPADPTRDGYTFVGWYKETTLTTLFDFAVDTVSVPTTLYAKWTPIEYNVTYNYNEGALVFATQADMFTAFLTDFHAFTQSTDTLAVFMDDAATTTVPFDGTWQSKAGDPADYVYLNKLYSGYRPTGPVAESQYFIENAAYYAKWMPFLDMIQGFVKTVNAGQNFWSPEVSDAPTFVGLIRLPQFIKGVKPIASISDAVMAQVPAYTKAHATYNISKVTTLPVPVKAGFVFAGWYDNAELTGTPMYEIPAGEMGELALYASYVADVASTGKIIVSPDASKLYFGNKIIIDGQVFEVGVNYFDNLVDAAAAVVTGDTVVVLPGTYTGDFAITVSDVEFVGPNSTLNPNEDTRGDEAVVDGVISISKELSSITIVGFKFVGQSRILNAAGTAGLKTAVTTNLNGFTFANNIVESALASGDGMIYFVEAADSYSHGLVFANNYFTVTAEGSTLVNMIRIDNNAGLDIVGNVFENIPGTAVFANDTSKGTAGNTLVAGNTFKNVTVDALTINWISPLPSTTMTLVVEGNVFDTVGGIAVYLGKMNNTDTIGALHVLHNDFKAVNIGVHMARVHATANALVNYNKFLDVPTTTYILDEKTATTPVTLDATKNAYLEGGKIITPDPSKFAGAPNIANPLTHTMGLNDFGNFEVTNAEFETNPYKLRSVFVADWNAKFGTTFTTLDPTAFFNSASTGAGGNTTKDVSGSNIYLFFHDAVYGPKWAWLIDYLQTLGGIHPQRQLIAIEGNGTSPDPSDPTNAAKNYQLWNLSHSIYSFANFFNQKADTNGWAPIDFNVPSKYATVKDFNNQIYRDFGLYDMTLVGDVVVLPEAQARTNYEFVEYQEGANVYAAGANYTVAGNIVLTAVYEAISYDVTFFDGETELTTLAATYTHEAAYTLPTPTKDGYLFQGWFDNATLEGTAVTAVAKGSTGDKVFYSKWLLLEYVSVEATFQLNGALTGTYVEATRYSTAGDTAGAVITVGTSRGGLYWYVIGMKATANAGVYEVVGKGTGYTNAEATLYLSYHDGCTSSYKAALAAEYTAAAAGDLIYIPWLPSAVTGTTSIDVLFLDSTITSVVKTMLLPEDFPIMMVKPNFTFEGWYDNATFTGEPVASYPGKTVNTPITYYAKWRANLIISQAYGGGGNSGATLKSDFVELYNPTNEAVDLTGWVLFYASATGDFKLASEATYGVLVELTGSIPAHGFYLIKNADGAGGTVDLPTPDATGTITMSGTGFKLALCNSGVKPTAVNSANVVDFVGAGATATLFEGAAAAPAPSNSTSIVRATLADTNNNSVDFTVATEITPRNSTYVPAA